MGGSPVTPGRDRPWLILVGAGLAGLIAWTVQREDIALEADDRAVAERVSNGESVAARAHASAGALPGIFSSDDYPASAMRREEQGLVGVSFRVDPRGRVDRCKIVQRSGSAALDEATCAIIKRRARFTPARNAQGRRVSDTSSSRVRWVLPEE